MNNVKEVLNEILLFLKRQKWLIENSIFPKQFLNYLIVLICSIDSKIKNVDINIDVNVRSITIIIHVPFIYKLKLNSKLLNKILFFLPNIKIEEVKYVLESIFYKWKINIIIH